MKNPKFEIELWWPEGWVNEQISEEEMIKKWKDVLANMLDMDPKNITIINEKLG
jgi:hypothetical protein